MKASIQYYNAQLRGQGWPENVLLQLHSKALIQSKHLVTCSVVMYETNQQR
jgi:hypothetical protein